LIIKQRLDRDASVSMTRRHLLLRKNSSKPTSLALAMQALEWDK
jgi:hypothetical protein